MERTFVRLRQYFINLEAISCVEVTEDGGMAVTLMNRDQPVRLSPSEASEFQQILGRFSLQVRSAGADD